MSRCVYIDEDTVPNGRVSEWVRTHWDFVLSHVPVEALQNNSDEHISLLLIKRKPVSSM